MGDAQVKGHIRRRGEQSWELKFYAGRDPITGARKIAYYSFKGTKRQAQDTLAELIASVGKGAYVTRSSVTVSDAHRSMESARQNHAENGRALSRACCQPDHAAPGR